MIKSLYLEYFSLFNLCQFKSFIVIQTCHLFKQKKTCVIREIASDSIGIAFNRNNFEVC